jgi:hypothetical protein
MLAMGQSMPPALCDIHPQSPELFESNFRFQILRRDIMLDGEGELSRVYFIQQTDSSSGLKVMLHDAATILECCRQFRSLAAIISFLFANGRPFRTFFPRDHIPVPQPVRVQNSPSLGYYPKNHRFGLREYHYYEQLRQEFCSLPRARAAIARGALVWRLALESIGAPAEEIISDGPSQEVFTHGTSFQDPDSSVEMCDDVLSEAEMDLMCGVYKVFTGEQ